MTSRPYKLFLKVFLALGLFIGLQQLIELKTHGFHLQKIQSNDLLFQEAWKIDPLIKEEELQIEKLLSQSYRLIGAGSECFAFVSDDGTTVIKFFKLDYLRPVYLRRGLIEQDHRPLAGTLSNHPLTQSSYSIIKRLLGIREFRIQRTFNSIKLAYDALKEETGLIYLHLNSTEHLFKPLTIYDSCGIRHQIDLDTTRFFLQKKAIPLESHFTHLKQTKDHIRAKASIDSLIDLFLTRCKKGYSDRDIRNRNLGYIGTLAIEIDSGSFMKNQKMQEPWIYKQEIFYATLELKNWLQKNYPEMVSYLTDRVSEEIHQTKHL